MPQSLVGDLTNQLFEYKMAGSMSKKGLSGVDIYSMIITDHYQCLVCVHHLKNATDTSFVATSG